MCAMFTVVVKVSMIPPLVTMNVNVNENFMVTNQIVVEIFGLNWWTDWGLRAFFTIFYILYIK